MPPRRKHEVNSLRNICVSYVSSNIDIWCGKHSNQFGEKINTEDNLFYCLPKTVLDVIFLFANMGKNLRPHHLDAFIHRYSKELNFSDTMYDGQIALRGVEIAGNVCVHLKYLRLSNCCINVESLKMLVRSIPSITCLYLHSTETTDGVLSLIGDNCLKLRVLDVSSCRSVTDFGICVLCTDNFASRGLVIQKLLIRGTLVTDRGAVTAICNLPYLTTFDYDNSLAVIEKSFIENSFIDTQFKLLSLQYCKSPYVGFTLNTAARLCQNVTNIKLSDVKSNDKWLSNLVNFPRLSDLSISGPVVAADFITFSDLIEPVLRAVGMNLKSLSLSQAIGINLWIIGIYCMKLKSLSLDSNYDYVSTLPSSVRLPDDIFGRLTRVSISNFPNHDISGDQLEVMLSNCQKLKSLSVNLCQEFTDELLFRVFERNSLMNVYDIDFYECNNITKMFIFAVINTCSELVMLYYTDCDKIEETDDIEIREFICSKNLYWLL